MPYWDCPKCAAENSLDATSCWRCGYQYYPGYQGAEPSRERPRPSRDSLQKQRQATREELRRSLEGALERSTASLDRLAGELPGPTGARPDSDQSARKKVLEPARPDSADTPRGPGDPEGV